MFKGWGAIRWTPKNVLKMLVLLLLIRPWIWFFLGLNRYSRFKLPESGPLILAANHNSHLDTVLILGLTPMPVALRMSIVAAGDYFFDIPVLSWVLFDLFEMIPVWRKTVPDLIEHRPASSGDDAKNSKERHQHEDAIEVMAKALQEGRVVVLFPEGTRGLPEQRANLKKGIARLALKAPLVPIIPIYLRGLGKSLPRGEFIFVPLIPKVAMDEPISSQGMTQDQIMDELAERFSKLDAKFSHKDWVST